MMFKYFNCFFSSFFRTLGRIIVYILLGFVFSSILSKIDVHADTIKGVYSNGYINGTKSFLSGMDEGNFSNFKSLSPGVEPTINLAIEDFTLSSENYLVVMTYCTTTTNYINVVTPQYDVTNAKLTGNFGTNNNLGLCRVGEYTGSLFQGVFGVSKFPNYESFQLRIWGGTSYTYNTFVQIVDVSLYYDTPETRNSFINNINSNKIIDNQNQINNKLNDMQSSINDINGSLNNSDTSGATNDAGNFFNDFTTDLHGLTGIITAPLSAINSLTSKTCSPLVLPLPFVDKDLTLPCMRSIYDEHFGAFMTLYDTITFGIVSYWVCVRIFSFVKDFKNPEHDEIEVVDL